MKAKIKDTWRAKLHNRQIYLSRLSDGDWYIQTKSLIFQEGKPAIDEHAIRFSDEAMGALNALYETMKRETK